MSLPAAVPLGEFATLFNFLPIGAYRSSPDGQMIRSNQALVELNGYASEAEHLAAVKDIGREWYVDPLRRDAFKQRLEHEGFVRGFVSEIWRHKTRERIRFAVEQWSAASAPSNSWLLNADAQQKVNNLALADLVLLFCS